MKLLSLLVFIGAAVGSWFLVHSKNEINTALHADIQSKLMIFIEETIKTQKPKASNFQVLNITTEKISNTQVKAVFKYSYDNSIDDGEATHQILKGDAVFFKALSEDPRVTKWERQSFNLQSDTLEFKKGLEVSAGPETGAPSNDSTLASGDESPKQTETH
jgi:hypothetical protein